MSTLTVQTQKVSDQLDLYMLIIEPPALMEGLRVDTNNPSLSASAIAASARLDRCDARESEEDAPCNNHHSTDMQAPECAALRTDFF